MTNIDYKTRAMTEGKSYFYISCPMCSMNRVLHLGGMLSGEKGKSGRSSFSNFDFEGVNGKFFIQVRKSAGGKGSGFYLDESQSLTWNDAIKNSEYADVLHEIKETCEKILKDLK
ncbi:MAG: hypothetical protein Q7R52_02575 [archaeon]|nr:hypothetical protein [archaeon]